MSRKIKGIICSLLFVTLVVVGCGKSSVVLDYGDAESFEAALNAGENLEGKTVRFLASELHPDSAMGYNIWAGEHLNFISARNPDIEEGSTADVRATEITSTLGSWFIKYEKVDNGTIGDSTITSSSSKSSNNETNVNESAKSDDSKSEETSNSNVAEAAKDESSNVNVEEELDKIEAVDAGMEVFDSGYGGKYVSAYMAIKNNSNINITFSDMRFEYVDDDGKLLSVDDYLNCIPEAIKPGQTGYIYSYYHSIDDVDLSNGFTFKPDGKTREAENFYEIEVSDPSFSVGSVMDIKVIGRGTNNTNKDHSLAEPGAIFFDSEGNVMGFCYGIESFDAGQTKAFEISGDILSRDYDPKKVSRVEVYIQGNDW